jgi:zinc and cadmium transporter
MLLSIGKKHIYKYISFIVAFAAGTLLGDTFLHLIPEALHEEHFGHEYGLALLGGFLISFVIERFIHWHHCRTGSTHQHRLATMNIVGDGIHNLLDGIAIAAAFNVSMPVGIATTSAIILHEIPQELGDFAILLYSGYSRTKAILYNLATATTSLVGVFVGLIAIEYFESMERMILLFTAGNFIYIAATDIMPELNRHESVRRSIAHLVALIVGISVMYLLLGMETNHK